MANQYHFIAIGGIGMSGLAKYLIQEGFEVSGSDINDSKYLNQLKNMGAKIFIGHDKKNIDKDKIIVVSSAIKADNPELIEAKRLNCTILHRSDILAQVASNSTHKFIGFAGTHGKTTTSGMASYVIAKSNNSPSFVVGGIVPELETNAEFVDNAKLFVAELDESDGTLVKYTPDIVVLNNLEADHLDFYKDGLKSIIETFNIFTSNLKPDAKILINNDDDGNLKLNAKNIITFGLNDADYVAKNIDYNDGYTTFDVYHNAILIAKSVKIILPGKHNVYNSLAVISACNEANISPKLIIEHLSTFTGMGRRFQKVLDINGVPVYDDYAHHPTEVSATLSAMKSFTKRNVVAVFQPHRYTRLQSLWGDFKLALEHADRLIITDVYAASEFPIDGISSSKLASEIKNAEYFSGSISDVAKKLFPTINNNDIVIGLGAGDITTLAKHIKIANEELSCK